MIGTILQDRYRINSVIGKGGMGTVYRAYDQLLNRSVAVKLLSVTLDSPGKDLLLSEARAVAKLNHPHIVSIYDAGQSDEAPFIVMELIEGQSLHDVPPTELPDIIDVLQQICLALTHAHDNGVIHRDLKPENILRSGNQIKLMDFGLAQQTADTSQLTTEGGITGTFYYVAPELIMGQPATPQADLYALGVIAYQFMTNMLPFSGKNLVTVLSQHMHASVVPPSNHNPDIPPVFENLIMQLLHKQPQERPPSAMAVHEQLSQIRQATIQPDEADSFPNLQRLARGHLIGRQQEFLQMRQTWKEVTAGKGQTLWISGEPGIGKTRLVRELTLLAEVSRAYVATGFCYAEGNIPYAPISQIIQQLFTDITKSGQLPDVSLAVLADVLTLVPALKAIYPEISSNPVLEPQAERQRLFDNITTFCQQVAKLAPVVLVIEDVHWADSGSLQFLRHLTRQVAGHRLFIVMTYREIEVESQSLLHQLLLDLNRERLSSRIKLLRLTKEQTYDLLTTLFSEEVTPDFLDGIYENTEGNPFFIEEVCKALIEAGQLQYEEKAWQRPDIADMQIPQSIQLAIQARLNKLPATTQETVQLAAIIGRNFQFDILQAVSQLDEDTLIDILESLEQAQLIEEMPATNQTTYPTFRFVHALIPTTACESLSTLRRRRLHRQVAYSLEKSYAHDLSIIAPQLGKHFAESGEVEKAVNYLLMAGENARQLYAYNEAILNYERALEFLQEEENLEQAAKLFLKLAWLYHIIFDFDKSRQAYQEGFTLWQQWDVQSPNVLTNATETLRVALPRIESIDPILAYDIQTGAILDQLFAGLVEITEDSSVMPAIALSWEIQDEGYKYVFHLRRDVFWSDGKPVTTHDFLYAWQRILNPQKPAYASGFLINIKGATEFMAGKTSAIAGVNIIHDFSFTIELVEPTGHFLYLLTHPALFPVPKHVVEKYGKAWTELENLVTNGVFKLQSIAANLEQLTLKLNPSYYGRINGNIQTVNVKLFDLGESSLDLYEEYQFDIFDLSMTNNFNPQETKRRFGDIYRKLPSSGIFYLYFDTTRPPFDDMNVRRAFAHAVDQQSLAHNASRGMFLPAIDGFIPPSIPGHMPNLSLPYNPQLAQHYLAEAGYPAGEGFPTIDFKTTVGFDFATEYLLQQYKMVLGVELNNETFSWMEFIEQIRSNSTQMHWAGWAADYPDPDNFLRVAFSTTPVHNKHYNDLISQAKRITENMQRIAIYQQAQRILVEEAYVVPLGYMPWQLLIHPRVKKMPHSPVKWWSWHDVVV